MIKGHGITGYIYPPTSSFIIKIGNFFLNCYSHLIYDKEVKISREKIDKINYLIFTPKKGYKQEIIYFMAAAYFLKQPHIIIEIFFYTVNKLNQKFF